jgi:hypothetical protein
MKVQLRSAISRSSNLSIDMGDFNRSCQHRRSVFTKICGKRNLGARSRDRRFSSRSPVEPNRESDFFNPSIPGSVTITDGGFGAAIHADRCAASRPRSDPSQRVTEFQERHAMTQTSEWGSKSETNSGSDFLQPSLENGVPARWSATALRSSAWRNLIDQVVAAATALVFAGLAPALVMASLWHTAAVAPIAFVFTFAIALTHAVLLGLPLFLVFRSKGWINIMTCVGFGFAVGAVPDGVLAWPMQHAAFYTSASVDGVPTIIDGVVTAAEWASYVKPLIYFGSLGALGGLAFWIALMWFGTRTEPASLIFPIHPYPAP